jgi:hypothetical protein
MPTTLGDEFVLVDPEYFDGKADSGVVLQLGQGGYSGWKGVTRDDVFCADTAGYQAALKSLNAAADVLYIRGHCAPGAKCLVSDNMKTRIECADVVALLHGELPFSFPGRVKVFACNSASAPWFSSSFVQEFADLMYANGYKSCRFYGYTAELRTLAKDGHKWVKGGSTPARARTAREEVTPGLLTKLFS